MHSDLDDPWQWKLRLFASADLVGSTAYKASQSARSSPDWVSTFNEFFSEFPSAVRAQYASLPSQPSHCSRVIEQLSPWKFLGDEILFSVELKRFEDAASHVLAFKNAVSEFPAVWRKKGLPLRLKGAAWLAGFPITNREVQIPSADGRPLLDFIGPSIDLGFRISKFADERRLVLSADLVLMLLDAVDEVEWEKGRFWLVLHGREILRGVIGNEGYPIVYLHMSDGRPDAEEKLLKIEHLCEWAALKDYLRKFIDERNPKLFRPFIANDQDQKYGQVPEKFEDLRKQLMSEESERGYAKQASLQEPAPSGPKQEPQATSPESVEEDVTESS